MRLVKLKTLYSSLNNNIVEENVIGGDEEEEKRRLFANLKETAIDRFDLEEVDWTDALDIVNKELGGMQVWFDGKCRTRIVNTF